jgi:valyl-tRNA synthetase
MLRGLSLEVVTLSTSSDMTLLGPGDPATPPPGCSVAIVDESTLVHMLLKGILDPSLEITKLEKKVRAGSVDADAEMD